MIWPTIFFNQEHETNDVGSNHLISREGMRFFIKIVSLLELKNKMFSMKFRNKFVLYFLGLLQLIHLMICK